MTKKADLKKIGKISKALGDPYRLEIIESVSQQQDWMQCTCILEKFNLAQSTMSHHIKQLVDAGLLIAEKDGRNAKYTLNKETMAEYTQYLDHLSK